MMTSNKTIFISTAQAILLLCILVLNTNALPAVASDERNYSLRGAITPTTSIDHENENSLPDIIDDGNDEITTSIWESVGTAFRKLLKNCDQDYRGYYSNYSNDKGGTHNNPSSNCKWKCPKKPEEWTRKHPIDYFDSKWEAKEKYGKEYVDDKCERYAKIILT